MAKHTNQQLDGELIGAEANMIAVLSKFYSNLMSILVKHPDDCRFLKTQKRADGDWLAILGIYGEDGTPLVAFGSGGSYVGALAALNATVGRGDWRTDKYP